MTNNLSYNITLRGQSNDTGCKINPLMPRECNFSFFVFPNLIGHQTLNTVDDQWKSVTRIYSAILQKSLFSGTNCRQQLAKGLYHLFYPPCDPESQQPIHVCKEMCQDMIRGCWDFVMEYLKQLHLFWSFDKSIVREMKYNLSLSFVLGECDYLPSVQSENSTCFYEPAKCGTLPVIPNANIIKQIPKANKTGQVAHLFNESCPDNGCHVQAAPAEQSNKNLTVSGLVFHLVDTEVMYSCVNNKGSKSIKCLHSGEWSKGPPCKETLSSVRPILLIFPIFIFPALSFVAYIFWLRCRGKKKPNQQTRRNREKDALISCNANQANDDYLVKTLMPFFEENQDPPFKLIYHERDFFLGQRIIDNIQDAVENSNSAVLSLVKDLLIVLGAEKSLTSVIRKAKKIQTSGCSLS